MKYRSDFVTNSSSSSFICVICGNVESGYDAGLSDVGMVECVNGHVFCEHHLLKDETSDESSSCDVSEKRCPVCQLKTITTDDFIEYIQKSNKINIKEVDDEIRSKFKTYKEFNKFLKKK